MKSSRVIIGILVIAFVLVVGGYVYYSIFLAGGGLSVDTTSNTYVPTVSVEDIPDEWKTFQYDGDLKYEIRYPSTWRVVEGDKKLGYWAIGLWSEDSNGAPGEQLVRITPGFPEEQGQRPGKTRYSNEEQENVHVALDFTPAGVNSNSFDITLLRKDSVLQNDLDLLVESFRFLNY